MQRENDLLTFVTAGGVIRRLAPAQDVAAHLNLPLAHPLARESQNDSDSACVIEAWPVLAEPIRRAILAMIDAASKGE